MAAKKKKIANPLDAVLIKYANERLAGKARSGKPLAELELLDFLVAASPHYQKPEHLAEIIPYLLEVEKKPTLFCFSAPPRHGKSVLINHFVAWMMIRHPGIKIAYGCYGEKLSLFFSDEVKDILTANGFEVDRTRNSRNEWRLTNGSLFKAVSPGGDFTGRGADLIIIDDPYKNRISASSGAVRETTWGWFSSVAITRRSPNCSVIVTHTRWHNDDIIGELSRRPDLGVVYKNFKAIDDSGEALWPAQWPVERLLEIKATIGEYDWASLYMGSPIPMGGAVFKDYDTYSDLDFDALLESKKLIKYVIGIDCAYTKKSYSDYSVAVVLAMMTNGKSYIVDVRREQTDSAKFAQTLKELRLVYDSAAIYWYVGGQEGQIAEFFRNNCGVPVKDMPAKEDKFARAQAVAAAWNAKKVLMPSDHKSWANDFITEVLIFSGLDDPHDDQVDALAAAYIPQSKPPVVRGMADYPMMVW